MSRQTAQDRKPTRREMFAGAGRLAAAAGLAAAAWLLAGRGRRPRPRSTCVNGGVCRSCSKLTRCVLPPAQYARRAEEAADG